MIYNVSGTQQIDSVIYLFLSTVIYNVSGTQQNDSVIYLFLRLFSIIGCHKILTSSLCYTVNLCCLLGYLLKQML